MAHLLHLNIRQIELIKEGIEPEFWRVPTDNDRKGWKIYNHALAWKEAAKTWLITHIDIKKKSDHEIGIEFQGKLPDLYAAYSLTYTIHTSGDIQIEANYSSDRENQPVMPRFGLKLTMPAGFDQLKWYGRGPHESQWDRKHGARVDTHQGSVDDQFVAYSRPQENGNKTDVRWVSLINKDGIGLLAVGMPVLNFTAKHYRSSEMEGARHLYMVPKHKEIFLNLDLEQCGVGGDDSWSRNAAPHPEFRLMDKSYKFSLRLKGFDKKTMEEVIEGRLAF